MSALAYHEAKGTGPNSALAKEIGALLSKAKVVLLPVHTRHHWALALFMKKRPPVVLDSAPSPPTKRDWERQFEDLHLPEPLVAVPVRQVRGSNECGIHVLLSAFRVLVHVLDGRGENFIARKVQRTLDGPSPTWSLHKWRPMLASLADRRATLTIDDLRAILTDPENLGAVPHLTEHRPHGGSVTSPDDRVQTVLEGAQPPVEADKSDDDVVLLPTPPTTHQEPAATFFVVRRLADRVLADAKRPGWYVASDVISAVCVHLARLVPDATFYDCDHTTHFANPVKSKRPRLERLTVFFMWSRDHYVVFAYSPFNHQVQLWDSLPGHIRSTDVSALRHAIQHAQGHNKVPELVEMPTPRQKDGSNDCIFHAIRNGSSAVGVTCDINRENVERACDPDAFRLVAPGPPKSVPHVSNLQQNDVMQKIKALRVRDLIEITWTTEDGFDGTWAGHVDRAYKSKQSRALATFTHFKCNHCERWHDRPWEDDKPYEMPYPQTTYSRISTILALPITVPYCEATKRESPSDDETDDDVDERAHADPSPTDRADDQDRPRIPHPDPAQLPKPDEDKAPLGTAGSAVVTGLNVRASVATKWFLILPKPPNIHTLVWKSVSPATRATHQAWLSRLRFLPQDLLNCTLPHAVIELILRRANERARPLRWSTIASSLSAAASAIRDLPLYTASPHGYDLRADPQYAHACSYAQQQARIEVAKSDPASYPGLPYEVFVQATRDLHDTRVWCLLVISWIFAARVGDARQLLPTSIQIDPSTADGTPVKATFTAGKGCSFWGPYTIHTVCPPQFATRLVEFIRAAEPGATLFTHDDQDKLSRFFNKGLQLTLRSIRRGSLCHLASLGVTDSVLQLLSGHKRTDTLMRYLGWGHKSSDAAKAAAQRANIVQRATKPIKGGAQESEPPRHDPAPHRHPMPVGINSGHAHDSGRRIEKPPTLCPQKCPSSSSLGVVKPENCANYTLHNKVVPYANMDAIQRMTTKPDLKASLALAREWTTSPRHYNSGWNPLHFSEIPYSRFTKEQVQQLVENDRLVPFPKGTPIRSGVNGFTVPEHAKKRLRVIGEPMVNRTADKSVGPTVTYPSRLEHRSRMANKRYIGLVDIASCYDHYILSDDVRSHFVVRVKPDAGEGPQPHLFTLARLPMGATFSAAVAQTATWAVCEPLIIEANRVQHHSFTIITMIDNITIGATSPHIFIANFRLLINRLRLANIKLNDSDVIDAMYSNDDEILRWGMRNAAECTFLGETYAGCGTTQVSVRNTEQNVQKIDAAFRNLDQAFVHHTKIPRRHIASLIGALVWAAHTINHPLSAQFELLRAWSQISRMEVHWDEPVSVRQEFMSAIAPLAQAVIANRPQPPHIIPRCSFHNSEYDVVCIIDAWEQGWGGFITFNTRNGPLVREVREGWTQPISHSAWSEPYAARRCIDHVRNASQSFIDKPFARLHIALVSDHIALASGQRRPWNGFAGFSGSYYLNSFYDSFYSIAEQGATAPKRDVFYVEGSNNIADALSRSTYVGEPLSARDVSIVFPSLSQFTMPIAQKERPWWNV